MTATERAIKEAEDNGANVHRGGEYQIRYFLDSSFWQALGEATKYKTGDGIFAGWLANWHRFIDHL